MAIPFFMDFTVGGDLFTVQAEARSDGFDIVNVLGVTRMSGPVFLAYVRTAEGAAVEAKIEEALAGGANHWMEIYGPQRKVAT